jgi:hypothetical protein
MEAIITMPGKPFQSVLIPYEMFEKRKTKTVR